MVMMVSTCLKKAHIPRMQRNIKQFGSSSIAMGCRDADDTHVTPTMGETPGMDWPFSDSEGSEAGGGSLRSQK